MRNQAIKSPTVESRGLNNKKAEAKWLMKNPPPPFVPSRVPSLLARSMATFTAVDLSSLNSGFDSAADGDVVEVSADITLTAQMCVLFFVPRTCIFVMLKANVPLVVYPNLDFMVSANAVHSHHPSLL